uniref:ATP synthase complex subunit 8 n=1 Tax=Phalantus geniculatus TaxID=1524594 RepID=A0A6B9IU14_9HEMI|nr:ATP synthase F0 subunit 8 [Phalantus geniculatus]
MPQMAPMWWTTLFFLFMISFLMMCINMHFQNIQISKSQEIKNSKTETMNWKW